MELVKRAAEKMGSEAKLAHELGLPYQQVNNVIHGLKKPTFYMMARCAEIVGERWTDHALPVLIEKARTPTERDYWKGKLERASMIGALGLALAFMAMIPVHGASENAPLATAEKSGTVDIM